MEAETKTLQKGQLILIATCAVDELVILYDDLIHAKTAYASSQSIRAGRKLRKVLLSIQKIATTGRAEVLTRRKQKASKSKAAEVLPERDLIMDPNQTVLL